MPERDCEMIALAQWWQNLSELRHERGYALHRRLHDRPEEQPLLRLRPHAAGDRALGPHVARRAARAEGRAACPYARRRPAGTGATARLSTSVRTGDAA